MYRAPEVIAFDRRGRSADIYSLGCVFAEMYTVSGGRRIEDFHDFRSEPVPDEPDRITLVYHATSHKHEAWFAMQDDSWPFSLISWMMADDPKTCPTAEDLLQTLARTSTRTCNCCSISNEDEGAIKVPYTLENDVPENVVDPEQMLQGNILSLGTGSRINNRFVCAPPANSDWRPGI